MKRYRRLRRLVPDAALVRRRAAGETLRELGDEYGVAHTTLGRYFARPEVARQLQEAGRLVGRERRAAAAVLAERKRLEREVRGQAKRQLALERERRLSADRAKPAGAPATRRGGRSAFEAWLDQRDARQPLTRADLRTQNDDLAAKAVAAGGGVQAVIEVTGLRTRENVLGLIDPVILVAAFENDAARTIAEPIRDGLRLAPDVELVRRRAAGESLRGLAADYEVAHTQPCAGTSSARTWPSSSERRADAPGRSRDKRAGLPTLHARSTVRRPQAPHHRLFPLEGEQPSAFAPVNASAPNSAPSGRANAARGSCWLDVHGFIGGTARSVTSFLGCAPRVWLRCWSLV